MPYIRQLFSVIPLSQYTCTFNCNKTINHACHDTVYSWTAKLGISSLTRCKNDTYCRDGGMRPSRWIYFLSCTECVCWIA